MSAPSTAAQSVIRFLGEELAALGRFEFVPEKFRAPLIFALRNWIASMAALYLAFFLQLDQPYWAGMTAWIVAQPTAGMAISRSLYRVVGTLIGTSMGVILVGLFPQSPELFILALALWLGGCTLCSNLLRGFTAYEAVLAGYTAAIISLGAYGEPGQVFYIAMARASATLLGIACATIAASLFAPHDSRARVISQMRDVVRTAARRAAFPLTGTPADRIALGRPLVAHLIELDPEIDFAGAESAEFRIHGDQARSLLAHVFGLVAAKRSLEDHFSRTGLTQDAGTVALYEESMRLLADGPRRMDAKEWELLGSDLRGMRARVRAHSPEVSITEPDRVTSARVVLDRLDDLLRHMERAIYDWCGIQGGWKWKPSLHLNFHRDQRSAWINGTRAFIAVIAAGIFWIASSWSSGSAMLIQAGVVCSLFSAAPRPDVLGFTFLKGAVASIFAAFICNFFVLQRVDGFPLFALALGIFLLPAAMLMTNPKTTILGLGFCVNFMGISRPLNPMSYDIVSFLNNGVATIIGVTCGSLAYLLFMPPNPQAARRYVVYRIRRGLQIISQRQPIPPPADWQTRMADRVNRLYDPANPSGTNTDEWFEGGLGAMNLGNEVLRLRYLLADDKLDERVNTLVDSVVRSFDDIVAQPDSTRFTIQAVSATLRETTPPEDLQARRDWFRAIGILQEMEAFFIEHPGFLSPK